jgi:hypothetical protein
VTLLHPTNGGEQTTVLRCATAGAGMIHRRGSNVPGTAFRVAWHGERAKCNSVPGTTELHPTHSSEQTTVRRRVTVGSRDRLERIAFELTPLSDGYAATRDALHRLAVYVISPAQRLTNGEIILRATPGGFGTAMMADGQIRVESTELVVERGGETRRAPITTLAEMAAFVGIEPDVAQQELFDVPPHGDLNERLAVDAVGVANLAEWYAVTSALLEELRSEASARDDVSPVRLWPEHFDAAIDLGDQPAGCRATYGGSPGDGHHNQPYLYVAPWAGRVDGFFADPTFKGASLTHAEIVAGADPGAFLREACRRISSQRG